MHKYMIFSMLFPSLIGIVFLILAFLLVKFLLKKKRNINKKQLNNIDKTIYYREIPCNGNIDLAFWLLYKFSNENKNELVNRFLVTYLLSWYKKGYINIKNISKKENGNNYVIELNDGKWNKTVTENIVYDYLKKVAGNNNYLEKNEIKNYCDVYGKSGLDFMIKNILGKIQNDLESNKLISVEKAKNFILFEIPEKIKLSQKLINDYQNLIGLKNFLLDFSNTNENVHVEVKYLDNYLLFANLLGVADTIKEQFNDLYPNFDKEFSVLNSLTDHSALGLMEVLIPKQIIISIFTLVLFLLILLKVFVFKHNKISTNIFLFMFIIFIIFIFYFLLKRYFLNKKVKEMNGTMYATITDVETYYDYERDLETNKEHRIKRYSFHYDYCLNGVQYTGFDVSNSKKKKGNKIKIYFNKLKPEESETKERHNYYLNILITLIIIFLIMLFVISILYK